MVSKPPIRVPCQAEMKAPVGSWKTAILPWSPTSNGAIATVPPASVTVRARASMSSVPMYRLQAVGALGSIAGPMPAASLPPILASA